jgi:hypothetical protein
MKGHKMKTKLITQYFLGGALSLGLLTTQNLLGQNALRFIGVNATPEDAIQLHWASNTNGVYEIDEADALIGTNNGSISWNNLYDDYPSQGTNTFWLDTGNYNLVPGIPHPKYKPMRFYRVVLTGTNTGPNPTITISSPTNGATVSSNLTVTISASSSQLLVQTILYVDGQEMPPSNDGTNFVINTCEWWNGQHTLFAVAKSQSDLESSHDSTTTYGRTASSYVNVTFNNLISEVAFSQPFFQPSLGETQQVTANFAANCNWTLQIQGVNGNTVCNASGSGTSMLFNWDGTGNGGINIPNGVYHYLISAQTNGQFSQIVGGGSDGSSGSPPLPSFANSDSPELWTMPINSSGGATPLAIYPPGFDTNNLIIFEASPSQMQALNRLVLGHKSNGVMDTGSGVSADDSISSTSSSQSTTAPVRPPNNPVKNAAGSIGIAYEQYLPQGFSLSHGPPTGWPYPVQPQFVTIDGGTNLFFDYIITAKTIGNNFSQAMQKGGWQTIFIKGNNNVLATDLKKSSLGGHSIFNNVTLGVLLGHGSYSTTAEDDNVKYSYFWLWNSKNNSSTFLRLADFDFGGSDPTNGLRWMTIIACNMLNQSDYNSMNNNSRLPINDNLHLLNGVAGTFYGAPTVGTFYATNLLGGVSIKQSWINAGTAAYKGLILANPVNFVTAGWPDCQNDTLTSYSSPDFYDALQYTITKVSP